MGWSEPFAGSWPVDAIVAENGAVALQSLPGQGLVKRYQQDETTRQRNYARMQEVLAQIEREVPGARRATDSPGRETTSPSTTASSRTCPSRALTRRCASCGGGHEPR